MFFCFRFGIVGDVFLLWLFWFVWFVCGFLVFGSLGIDWVWFVCFVVLLVGLCVGF